MTVEEMLTDLWYSLGKNTELDPFTGTTFDITTAGATRMLGWLNRGYRIIADWKRNDGSGVQFSASYDELYFQTQIVEGTVASATDTTVTVDSSAGATADQYNGWLIRIESGTGAGQVRLITDYSALRAATVHTSWDTNPDSTSEYTLYKRFMRILNSADTGASENITQPQDDCVKNPLKITDLYQQRDIPYGGRVENWPGNITSAGIPSAWTLFGNTIVFNYAMDEERWYRLEYEAELAALTAASQEPKLPEPWQEMLFLWLLWKGRVWTHEPNAAYGAKRDLWDFAEKIRMPREQLMDREDGGAYPDLEG